MTRWIWTLQARHPGNPDGAHWQVGLDQAHIEHLRSKGHKTLLARLILVEETLKDTTVIIRGWSRPGKEDCYVYVGKPKHDRRSAVIETPAPPNKVFLVFVLPNGTIDHWTWRDENPEEPGLPQGVTGETLWRQTRR
jgi:hypothetical protein